MIKHREALIGQKFEKLTVVSFGYKDHYEHIYWKCRCECGKDFYSCTRALKANKATHCGCSPKKFNEAGNWKGEGKLSKTFWSRILRDAKKRDIKVDISIKDAWNKFQEQKGICVYSGKLLDFGNNKNDPQKTASLDRIDSDKDYTKDNIQWVHKHINIMKQDYSEEYFLSMIQDIFNFKMVRSPK